MSEAFNSGPVIPVGNIKTALERLITVLSDGLSDGITFRSGRDIRKLKQNNEIRVQQYFTFVILFIVVVKIFFLK